jgi:hypothetical protein
MKQEFPFQKAPRCTATSKRTSERCRAPAVRGCNVCRFHGAGGGAPEGRANGRYNHGLYTADAISERRRVTCLIGESKKTLKILCEPGSN